MRREPALDGIAAIVRQLAVDIGMKFFFADGNVAIDHLS
jgi:hypothetical protein